MHRKEGEYIYLCSSNVTEKNPACYFRKDKQKNKTL